MVWIKVMEIKKLVKTWKVVFIIDEHPFIWCRNWLK